MSVSPVIITMRIPVADYRYFYIQFDGSRPVDFAPLLKLNGAQMAQQSAPLYLKPLKENGAGAPLLHSPPTSAQEWRNTSPSGEFLGQPKTLEEELADTRNALANRSSELARFDGILSPVRAEEREIQAAILVTHHRAGNVVHFDHGRAPERRPLFAALSAISAKWGKLKAERASVNTHVKSLEREIIRLQRLIDSSKKKRA